MDFTEIIPERLWIGPAPSKTDLEELKRKHGADLVIMDLLAKSEEKSWCRELSIAYDERTPKIEPNKEAISLSKLKVVSAVIGDNIDSGKKVVLHDLQGKGRSPTCAAAYLIQSGMSVAEAKSTITTKRPVWGPDDANYAASLEDFGKILEMTRSMF